MKCFIKSHERERKRELFKREKSFWLSKTNFATSLVLFTFIYCVRDETIESMCDMSKTIDWTDPSGVFFCIHVYLRINEIYINKTKLTTLLLYIMPGIRGILCCWNEMKKKANWCGCVCIYVQIRSLPPTFIHSTNKEGYTTWQTVKNLVNWKCIWLNSFRFF